MPPTLSTEKIQCFENIVPVTWPDGFEFMRQL